MTRRTVVILAETDITEGKELAPHLAHALRTYADAIEFGSRGLEETEEIAVGSGDLDPSVTTTLRIVHGIDDIVREG